eukprot:COSAG04_NODE_17166_length_477_cov_0.809524_2_plen_96_part_01
MLARLEECNPDASNIVAAYRHGLALEGEGAGLHVERLDVGRGDVLDPGLADLGLDLKERRHLLRRVGGLGGEVLEQPVREDDGEDELAEAAPPPAV